MKSVAATLVRVFTEVMLHPRRNVEFLWEDNYNQGDYMEAAGGKQYIAVANRNDDRSLSRGCFTPLYVLFWTTVTGGSAFLLFKLIFR